MGELAHQVETTGMIRKTGESRRLRSSNRFGKDVLAWRIINARLKARLRESGISDLDSSKAVGWRSVFKVKAGKAIQRQIMAWGK